ncbi:uncharacterized protein LOC143913002 isoform X2 [Arctopsyche grandis]|uniref:uncharacterized protein LOC143913002 isoform X2 n=1 Tax=Arctopsyche grandis TaxID=121162 RepID=UPI00406D6F42
MECRLCLSSSPAEDLVSIHDDPRRLEHLIWTCCRLRVSQEDELPDMVCLSCVNNLELLDGFRNACFRSDTTSRVEIDKYFKVKPEELLVDDLIWQDDSGADCPPNISSSAENSETDAAPTATASIPQRYKRKATTNYQEEFFKVCTYTLKSTSKELSEFDITGINIAKKLGKMDPLQEIYAESIISTVVRKGLLKKLTKDTDLCDNHCNKRVVIQTPSSVDLQSTSSWVSQTILQNFPSSPSEEMFQDRTEENQLTQ